MLLGELSNARGVSGDEGDVRDLIVAAIKDHVDEYRVDSMGNLIACKRAARRAGRGHSPRVLLAAHMDEVGLIITHVEGDGRLRFDKVGGIDDRVLLTKTFLIGPGRVPGVLGVKPIHLSTTAERQKVISSDDMTIDIGARSKEDALGAVALGDYATFDTHFSKIGENMFRGKALDDRLGCSILVDLVHQDYPFDLYAAFTAQEEIGVRGGRVAGYSTEPDIAIVLESTAADDTPREKEQSPALQLDGGPAVTVADRSMISDKRLVRLIVDAAGENDIPFQIKQPLIGGTDAGRLHLTREGVPSVVVSVPTRYIHSPVALASLSDYENTRVLVGKTLLKLQRGLPHRE